MNLREAEREESVSGRDMEVPEEIQWRKLDKGKFFLHGAALFSAVSAVLYPVVVLKTRKQVGERNTAAAAVVRAEGFRGLYRGFGTSLAGTVPARAVYMTALEVTKGEVGVVAVRVGCTEATASTVANAAGGLSAAVAAQLVWTPVDVVSQRLMVCNVNDKECRYLNGIDCCRKIVRKDGVRGLYRGFGISILTYAPSNAVWWASYSVAQRAVWGGVGWFLRKDGYGEEGVRPDWKTVVGVQGLSAGIAGGVAALVTTPLDTIKTRMQVLDGGGGSVSSGGGEENGGRRGGGLSVGQTVRSLVKEGGWLACYRGLGLRWASMSISATTMITTYEFLKRVSTKSHEAVT